MPSGFPFYFQYKEDIKICIRILAVCSHDKRFVQIMNKQATEPPPPTPFIYHFTFSFTLFYYLFSLPWDWKSWGLAVATGGWAVIRDWVVRMGSGLFGHDCIQWLRAGFCSQGWQHTVPWSPGHPCALEHSSSPWEAAGQGAEAWVPHLGLDWVGSCVACSVAKSHMGFLFLFSPLWSGTGYIYNTDSLALRDSWCCEKDAEKETECTIHCSLCQNWD